MLSKTKEFVPFLALIVSVGSAIFSYIQAGNSAQQARNSTIQANAAAAQLHLNEQQLRPHVNLIPFFSRTRKGLELEVHTVNFGSLPANVLYSDLGGWVGEQYLVQNFHTVSPDIVHPGRGGVSTPPPLTAKPLALVNKGERFLLSACAVYAVTSGNDKRRWLLRSLHAYLPGESFGSRLFIKEEEVSAAVENCEAARVREYFMGPVATSSAKASDVKR